MATLPLTGTPWLISWGLSTPRAALIARAATSISGTKISPSSYSCPTCFMAAINPSFSSVPAEMPSASPAVTAATAALAFPSLTASRRSSSTAIIGPSSHNSTRARRLRHWLPPTGEPIAPASVLGLDARVLPRRAHGIVEGQQVLYGNAGLNVVNRVEHKAAACAEDAHAIRHHGAHVVRRAERQHALR